jgi:hypothetical protein
VGFSRIVQRSLLADKFGLSLLAAPGTDDPHFRPSKIVLSFHHSEPGSILYASVRPNAGKRKKIKNSWEFEQGTRVRSNRCIQKPPAEVSDQTLFDPTWGNSLLSFLSLTNSSPAC